MIGTVVIQALDYTRCAFCEEPATVRLITDDVPSLVCLGHARAALPELKKHGYRVVNQIKTTRAGRVQAAIKTENFYANEHMEGAPTAPSSPMGNITHYGVPDNNNTAEISADTLVNALEKQALKGTPVRGEIEPLKVTPKNGFALVTTMLKSRGITLPVANSTQEVRFNVRGLGRYTMRIKSVTRGADKGKIIPVFTFEGKDVSASKKVYENILALGARLQREHLPGEYIMASY